MVAPNGAMSSPWCQKEDIKALISNTEYFKDAKVNNESPTKQEVTKCSVVTIAPSTNKIPDSLKASLNKFFINNNIGVISITDDIMVINFENHKLEVRLV